MLDNNIIILFFLSMIKEKMKFLFDINKINDNYLLIIHIIVNSIIFLIIKINFEIIHKLTLKINKKIEINEYKYLYINK